MTLTIKDEVGLTESQILSLASSLIQNRKKEDGINYGLETHGLFGVSVGSSLPFPVQVFQLGVRLSEKSKLNIVIKKHIPV